MSPRILIVEDDPEISRVLQFALGDDGYRVAVATDGELALGECAIEDPALVLFDLNLPRMDGAEFLRRYRARERSQAKVIVLSALNTSDPLVRQVEPDVFIGKPFDIEHLVGTVRRLVLPEPWAA